MPIHAALSRFLPDRVRPRILAVLWIGLACAAAAGFGLAAATGAVLPAGPFLAALGAAGAGLSVLLWGLLAPVALIARAVESWGRTGRVLSLPEEDADELGRTMTGINRLLARAQRSLDRSWSAEDCDPATGVLTRAAAERLLGDAGAGWLIGLEIGGCDGFASRHGRERAEEFLCEVAHNCTDIVRQDDIVARFGSHGFLLYLPGAPEQVARRIVGGLSRRLGFDDDGARRDGLTVCYGIAGFAGGGAVAEGLRDVARAVAMAQARGPGAVAAPSAAAATAA